MNLIECPGCGSKNFEHVLEVKDHLVSGEGFTISECQKCSLRFTNPRPEAGDLSKYYQSENYISHTNEANNLVNKLYKIARYFTLRSKRRLIEKNVIDRTLLDIGCGTGHFLEHASANGWQTYGIEPEKSAREIAIAQGKSKIYSDINEVIDQQFDRITLWHVLEHLPDLNDSLDKIANLMSSEGKLFIAVPNYLAHEEARFKEFWAAYDVPRHLYHFSPNSMKEIASRQGLIIEKIYPMRLDSFYISLLSNKHKSGRNKLINSFISGLISNTYGLFNGNYSSLIYQLSKKK